MAVTIIVEDGSIVPGANSYQTVSVFRAYAEARGYVLPTEDDAVAVMLIKGTDYLQAQACRYQGRKVSCEQALEWPRKGVYLCCDEFPENKIPPNLIAAQAQLGIAINEGFELQPNYSAADFVTEETVGPITTKYADPTAIGIQATFTAVDGLLKTLFDNGCSGGFALRSRRV